MDGESMEHTDARLHLYRYATVPESGDYLEIMRRFSASLLAEWSAAELVEDGLDLPVEVVDQRLRYLAGNRNIVESPREIRVTSISEYQRQPARYSITTLGSRVHRQVEEVLAAGGGAREVSQELVPSIAQRLAELTALCERPGGLDDTDPASLGETVTTLFLQFADFAASVTDFYTYVGSILNRADLDDEELVGFKGLLLDYLESIVDNVARYTPSIRSSLDRIVPRVDDLIARIEKVDAKLEALRTGPGGEGLERSPGRVRSDWDELWNWFGSYQSSDAGVDQLRQAAGRAIGILLGNLKRINASSSREESMRRHFLRLAGWFDAATPEDAHDLFTAGFSLYGARHIGFPVEPDLAEAIPATASWWHSPPADVPVTLRERGNRTMVGRSTRVVDRSDQKHHLRILQKQAMERRRGACAELVAVGDRLDAVTLTGPAMEVLLELLGRATALRSPGSSSSSAAADDALAELWLVDTPGRSMTVTSDHGSLVLDGRVALVGRPGSMAALALEVEGGDSGTEAVS